MARTGEGILELQVCTIPYLEIGNILYFVGDEWVDNISTLFIELAIMKKPL